MKTSKELQAERDQIARELRLLKRAKDPVRVVDHARELRHKWDSLGERVELAAAVETIVERAEREESARREAERQFPLQVSQKEVEEYNRLEADPGGPTAEWRGTTIVVRRGCTLCGFHLVRVAGELVGYSSLRASGKLCKKCETAMAIRENGALLGVLGLVVTDRLRKERPDLVRGVANDQFRTDWPDFTWAGRLATVDRAILAQQEPPSAPFGYLTAPSIQSSPGNGEREEGGPEV